MLDTATKVFSLAQTCVQGGPAAKSVQRPSPTTQVGAMCISLILNRRCNFLEEILALSVLAYCIATGEVVDGYFGLLHGFIQVHCMGIRDVPSNLLTREPDRYGINDFLLWAKMVLLATYDHDTQTNRIAVKLRASVPLKSIRLRHFDISRRYFWNDNLTSCLGVRVGRERVVAGSKTGSPLVKT